MPEQVSVTAADKHDLSLIASELKPFCEQFGMDEDEIMSDTFYALRPNTKKSVQTSLHAQLNIV